MGWLAGERNVLFYDDDCRIAGRDHEWVQDALTVMVMMFRRVGLDTNHKNTKYIVCTYVFVWGNWSEEAYKLRSTGEGSMFREGKRIRLSCTECGMNVAALSLKKHMARLHGICVPQTRGVNKVGGLLTTYVVSLPSVLKLVK